MHMTYTVELQQAAVGYGEKTVVRDITLHVRSGEILALIIKYHFQNSIF